MSSVFCVEQPVPLGVLIGNWFVVGLLGTSILCDDTIESLLMFKLFNESSLLFLLKLRFGFMKRFNKSFGFSSFKSISSKSVFARAPLQLIIGVIERLLA